MVRSSAATLDLTNELSTVLLAQEPPSHIVAPAIHKNHREVVTLFQEHHPEQPYTEDINQLTQNAREILRDKFA